MKRKLFIITIIALSVLGIVASSTFAQTANIPISVPSAPGANYVLLSTTTGKYVAVATSSLGITGGGIGGSISSGQIAFGSTTANTITGLSNFYIDTSNASYPSFTIISTSGFPNSSDPTQFRLMDGGSGQMPLSFVDSLGNVKGYLKVDTTGYNILGALNSIRFEVGGFGSGSDQGGIDSGGNIQLNGYGWFNQGLYTNRSTIDDGYGNATFNISSVFAVSDGASDPYFTIQPNGSNAYAGLNASPNGYTLNLGIDNFGYGATIGSGVFGNNNYISLDNGSGNMNINVAGQLLVNGSPVGGSPSSGTAGLIQISDGSGGFSSNSNTSMDGSGNITAPKYVAGTISMGDNVLAGAATQSGVRMALGVGTGGLYKGFGQETQTLDIYNNMEDLDTVANSALPGTMFQLDSRNAYGMFKVYRREVTSRALTAPFSITDNQNVNIGGGGGLHENSDVALLYGYAKAGTWPLLVMKNSSGVQQIGVSYTGDLTLTGGITVGDAKNFVVGATTGTKFGTATSQKIGFWNTAPIVQPTTAFAAATFTANSGTAVNDASTFDGYTLKQVVKALRSEGLLQ